MRRIFTALLAGAFLLLSGLPAPCQTVNRRPAGSMNKARELRQSSSTASLDPSADTMMFRKMSARMDSIRKAEGRPTVALVLSGGGAKGAAHVGVIKYLEEKRIPVDMVLGTSMGGLVGGLYALGYSADDLDEIIRSIDWDKALTDAVDQQYIPYSVKMRRQRYIVSIPFHYNKKDFVAKVEEGVRYSARKADVKLSAVQEDKLVNSAASTTSFNSLPSGMMYGLNVNNLIASKTVGYHSPMDFSKLPIPFFCVASDLVSCKAMNWYSGPLNVALRSTMSIPVLFKPVRFKDMILVDGGMRNNFPSDLARKMGADIVIGVVLADADKTYEEINNVADMMWQFMDMLSREAYVDNSRILDVYIHPDLHEYNMLSFGTEQKDTILNRGYRAAKLQDAGISAVKELMPSAETRLQAPPAVNIEHGPVSVHRVFFHGVDGKDAVYLRKECGIAAGQELSMGELEAAVAKLYSSDALDAVSYTLSPDGDGYDLHFNCVKGPVHRIGVTARVDSEERVAAMLNLGLNVNKLRGPRLDMEARIGQRWYGKARFSLTAPTLPMLNLEGIVSHTDANLVMDSHKYIAGYWHHTLDGYLSGIHLRSFDFRAGMRYEYFSLNSWLTNSGQALTPHDMETFTKRYTSFYSNIRRYTLDDLYYPTRGYSIGAEHSYILGSETAHIISADAKAVLPFGPSVCAIPEFYTRHVIDPAVDRFYHSNFVGGSLGGRYMEGQIPFVGFHDATILEKSCMVINLDIRANIFKNTFLSLQGGYIWTDRELDFKTLDLSPKYYGAAVELGYDAFIGPVKAKVQWSNFLKWQAYVSTGFDF